MGGGGSKRIDERGEWAEVTVLNQRKGSSKVRGNARQTKKVSL